MTPPATAPASHRMHVNVFPSQGVLQVEFEDPEMAALWGTLFEQVQEAREKGAKVVRFTVSLTGKPVPIVVTGNALPGVALN